MSWNTAHTAIASLSAITIFAIHSGLEVPFEAIIGALGAWAVVRQTVKSVKGK
jgi:hypothetical protein